MIPYRSAVLRQSANNISDGMKAFRGHTRLSSGCLASIDDGVGPVVLYGPWKLQWSWFCLAYLRGFMVWNSVKTVPPSHFAAALLQVLSVAVTVKYCSMNAAFKCLAAGPLPESM